MTTVSPNASETPKKPDADLRKGGRDDGAAAAREGEPESADRLGSEAFAYVHVPPPLKIAV